MDGPPLLHNAKCLAQAPFSNRLHWFHRSVPKCPIVSLTSLTSFLSALRLLAVLKFLKRFASAIEALVKPVHLLWRGTMAAPNPTSPGEFPGQVLLNQR